jgi:hypothetical protein
MDSCIPKEEEEEEEEEYSPLIMLVNLSIPMKIVVGTVISNITTYKS